MRRAKLEKQLLAPVDMVSDLCRITAVNKEQRNHLVAHFVVKDTTGRTH